MFRGHLLDPVVHDLWYVQTYFHELFEAGVSVKRLTARLCDSLPQVLRNAVRVQVLLEVDRDTLEELFFRDVARQHAQD